MEKTKVRGGAASVASSEKKPTGNVFYECLKFSDRRKKEWMWSKWIVHLQIYPYLLHRSEDIEITLWKKIETALTKKPLSVPQQYCLRYLKSCQKFSSTLSVCQTASCAASLHCVSFTKNCCWFKWEIIGFLCPWLTHLLHQGWVFHQTTRSLGKLKSLKGLRLQGQTKMAIQENIFC